MFSIGVTDHLEGPADRPSCDIFDEVSDLVRLADRLGVRYAWFAEHHGHAHQGHLPTPLLLALHLAGQTLGIKLGTAIICLNLHHPIDVAEQVVVADLLAGGRLAVGFGSGSTPGEAALFGVGDADEAQRHARFEAALRTILAVWRGEAISTAARDSQPGAGRLLPIPRADLAGRCWVAVNSVGAARIAGMLGFNMLFSHLRTVEQYRQYRAEYASAGGTGLVAINRPVFVGPDDESAMRLAEPALRILWRRFGDEGKIAAGTAEPSSTADLCAHPVNFIVGGPRTVARQLLALHDEIPFDVANVEVRWAGLSHDLVFNSLSSLMEGYLEICRTG
jgi:alkanesulfonate monooxygenase SsuD/methylene tetrahydromethanopterin reductase-like flavin-dependent oxidoreductase (luciferase family)